MAVIPQEPLSTAAPSEPDLAFQQQIIQQVGNRDPELASLLAHKLELEIKIASLEKQIYSLEARYLEDTTAVGNIVRGWGGYLSKGHLKTSKVKPSEHDRIFSLSSVSSQASRNLQFETAQKKQVAGTINAASGHPGVSSPSKQSKRGPGRPRRSSAVYGDGLESTSP